MGSALPWGRSVLEPAALVLWDKGEASSSCSRKQPLCYQNLAMQNQYRAVIITAVISFNNMIHMLFVFIIEVGNKSIFAEFVRVPNIVQSPDHCIYRLGLHGNSLVMLPAPSTTFPALLTLSSQGPHQYLLGLNCPIYKQVY